MPMTIYKLYASEAGDSVANLDVQLDGIITAILMTCEARGVDSINEGIRAEVSFLSINTFITTDTRGSLMIIQSISGLLTSGMLNTATNMNVSGLEVPVAAGERIHLHIADVGTLSARAAHAYLYITDKGIARPAARRR